MRRLFTARFLTYALLACIACAGIFVLPFYFPPFSPVNSESYIYGFNNKVSFLSVLLSIGLFFLAALRWNPLPADSLLSTFDPQAEGKTEWIKPWVVWLGCLLMLATAAYFYLHTGNLGYGESAYFVKRMLFVLQGRRPYTDFEFAYGPALLYPPVYLYRLTEPFGMSVEAAYCLYYGLASATGLFLLAVVVNSLGIKGRHKTILFVLCGLIAWNETMGLQYTLLRYVVPMNCLLLIHLGIVPWLTSAGFMRLPQQIILALASVVCTAVCLLISPEMGVAFFVAMGVYWTYRLWTNGTANLLPLLVHVASLSLAFTPWCREWFRSVSGFSGGGCNFPVLPAMNILLLLFTVLYTVPAQLRLGLTKRRESQTAISMGWAALTVTLLPGALGRCDWGHTFFYGLPALIAASVYLLKHRRSWFTAFVIAAAICFLCLKVSHFNLAYRGALPYRLLTALHRYRHANESADRRDPSLLARGYLGNSLPELRRADISRFGVVGVPLGCSADIFLYLLANNLYRHEYYDAGMNIFAPQQLDAKLAELKTAKTILAPKQEMDNAYPEFWKRRRPVLSELFLFPFGLLAEKNPPFIPEYEIVQYIRANYEPIASVEDNYLMQARPDTAR